MIVWCMMHWVRFDDDLTDFAALADDMTAVFKTMRVGRRGNRLTVTAGSSGTVSRKRRADEDEEQEGEAGNRTRKSAKRGARR